MAFFNTKEETITIELTKHGRELLSKGKLKPAYYSFSDDDILYDSAKGGFSETNSEIKTRIMNETPRIKPIPSRWVESDHSNLVGHEKYNLQVRDLIGTVMQNNTLTAPAWNALLLEGEIESISNSLDDSIQIDCILEYSMSFGRITSDDQTYTNSSFPFGIKDDGTYFNIEEEDFLLHLVEKNADITKDSFELEVFLYEEDEVEMNQLFFAKEHSNIIGDFYQENQEEATEPTPEHVEYYFNVLFDREVPDEDICKGLANIKNENIYLDYDLKCPDRDPLIDVNIYGSTITEEDLEEC